jgi:hypothetical protein
MRARLVRALSVMDEVVRAVKFLTGILVLCLFQVLIVTGPMGGTPAAWVAVGVLVACEVVLLVLSMLRWPPR